MASLSNDTLLKTLRRSLPNCNYKETTNTPKPAEFVNSHGETYRIYIWTTTPDRSVAGRPLGENKAQIILPGTKKGERQHFNFAGNAKTFLLGYSPLFGVFSLWEVYKHQDSGYSKNLQVSEELLETASQRGWAIAPPRTLNAGEEVRCAVHPANLEHLLEAVASADDRGLEGEHRQIFLESKSPELKNSTAEKEEKDLEEVINQRNLVYQARLERDRNFASRVLPLYGNSCAVCGSQLNIVEAAHIIPVHSENSTDEPENGISLCRNHHRLYDNRILLIDGEKIVRIDDEVVRTLKDAGRARGLETLLLPFKDQPLSIAPVSTEENFESKWKKNLKSFYESVKGEPGN